MTYPTHVIGESGDTGRTANQQPAFQLVHARDLMKEQFEPLRWIVPDIVPEGLVLLAGKPKTGKSWLGLAIALGVASGRSPLDGCPLERGAALYLALEDSKRRLHNRLNKLLGGREAPARFDLMTECPRLDQGGHMVIEQWISEQPEARLVVVDTLAAVRPSDQPHGRLYQEDYQALQGLRQVANAQRVTVLVLHHLRKQVADDPLDEISGTTGLTGAADGVLVLRRRRGDAHASLTATGRDIEEQERRLAFDAASGAWTWSAREQPGEPPLSQARAEILGVLSTSSIPFSPAQVSAHLQKNPVTVRKLLSEMAKAGEVLNPSHGLYTNVATR